MHSSIPSSRLLFLLLPVIMLCSCSDSSEKENPYQKEKTGLFHISSNRLVGLMDKKGNMVLEPIYESIGEFKNGYASFSKNGKSGLINKEGEIISEAIFDYAPSALSDGLFQITMGGKYGYADEKGKLHINPQFDYARSFEGGYATVDIDGKDGIIDKNGSWIISPQYDQIGNMKEGLAKVKIGQKWGYIDEAGKIVINPQFDDANDFKNGITTVKLGNRWGLIGKEGKYIVNPQFDFIFDYSDPNWILVNLGSNYGVIDQSGKYILNPQYNSIRTDKEGLVIVETSNGTGVIDQNGNYVLNPIEGGDVSSCLSRDRFIVSFGYGKSGIVNEDGVFLVQPTCDYIYPSDNGFHRIQRGGKYSFVDEDGKLKIPVEFENAYDFVGSFAWAKMSGLWGLIDKSGDWQIQPQYRAAQNFFDDLAMVMRQDYATGYINTKGEEVGQFFYANQIAPKEIAALMDQYFTGWEYANGGFNSSYFQGNRDKYALEPFYLLAQLNGDGLPDHVLRIKGEMGRYSSTKIIAFVSKSNGGYNIFALPGSEFLTLIPEGDYYQRRYYANDGIGTGALDAGDGPGVYTFSNNRFRESIWDRRTSYYKVVEHNFGSEQISQVPINAEELSNGQELVAWVDKLNIRALPKLDADVVYQMKAGERGTYLGEKSADKHEIRLRGIEFNQPFLKIRCKTGEEGWVYGGAVQVPK